MLHTQRRQVAYDYTNLITLATSCEHMRLFLLRAVGCNVLICGNVTSREEEGNSPTEERQSTVIDTAELGRYGTNATPMHGA
jgi:hypothetical protein